MRVFEQNVLEYDQWFDVHELVCRAEVAAWVKKAGFGSLRFCRILFDRPDELVSEESEICEGSHNGAFVVLSAGKRERAANSS